ncbi:MAG: Protease HtpX [Chlamydiae bacterium]|nr:Protease HtpX [Chlamydiota bacterium]
MNSYLFADHLLQHALNGVVSFLLFSLITTLLLVLLRIRSPRLRASLRLLPPLRLALEPLFWLLPSSVTVLNASAFSCVHPFQRFLYRRLSLGAQQELEVYGLKTVLGKGLLLIPLPLLYVGMVLILGLSIFRLVAFFLSYLTARMEMKRIAERGSPYLLSIRGEKLLMRLQNMRVKIVLSDDVMTPLACWGKTILLPQSLLEEFSDEEREAIIAHELEHHRWHDTCIRMLYQGLSAFYFWVPMSGWLGKIKEEQELACDLAAAECGLSTIDLATALKKTLWRGEADTHLCAAFTTKRSGKALFRRLQALLDPHVLNRKDKVRAGFATLLLGAVTALVGFVVC